MKILLAVDQNPYSAQAVEKVAKLAANTWANVSLVAIQSKNGGKPGGGAPLTAAGNPLIQALFEHRETFLSYFDKEECPYASTGGPAELKELKKGVFEVLQASQRAKKTLRIRLRTGSPGKEILSEAREEESDLIVLGCDHLNGCAWESGASVPRKVANEAQCSVLIAKAEKNVKRMLCCLDHDRISQASLEMINQMVTLHGAQLTIVGLAENQSLKAEVEKKLDTILRYYQERGIDPWIELVDISSLDSFIAQEGRWGLMALWMGKQSILEKALPRSKVNKLIKGSEASVVILR
jgi:nucleotide-binding universal stress UspA family protein